MVGGRAFDESVRAFLINLTSGKIELGASMSEEEGR